MQDMDTDQLAELRQTFDSCDGNGDGRIASAEFAAVLQALDQDLSDDECLLAFELADADGSGSIDFEEFLRWWSDE
jgi:Ca2+-binding EF-hand superfamily protein